MSAVRGAMAATATARLPRPGRQIMDLGDHRVLAVMHGAVGPSRFCGVKAITVFGDPARPGRHRHRGTVTLFDATSGELLCVVDAEAVTRLRTAATSAVATDVLATAGSNSLGVFGTGVQAYEHVRFISLVRRLDRVVIWGRDFARGRMLADRVRSQLGLSAEATEHGEAAADCEILCTVTASPTPILPGAWVRPGAHVNLVGSSRASSCETDTALVAKSRFFADSRGAVQAQGAEFILAKASGVVGDDHIVGELGDVLSGTVAGRQEPDEITVFKSLGCIEQDLAAAWIAYEHSA